MKTYLTQIWAKYKVNILLIAFISAATLFLLNDAGLFNNSNESELVELKMQQQHTNKQLEAVKRKAKAEADSLLAVNARLEQDLNEQREYTKKVKHENNELKNALHHINNTLPRRPVL